MSPHLGSENNFYLCQVGLRPPPNYFPVIQQFHSH